MNLEYFKNKFSYSIAALLNAKNAKRLAHAYMIYSDDAEIRESFAKILAKTISCKADNRELLFCNKCQDCRKIDKDIYPDMYSLSPVSKSRRIVIGENEEDIDTMRWFQSRFFFLFIGFRRYEDRRYI